MHPLLNVATLAARKGGDSLVRSMRRLDELNVSRKGRNDYVSDADRQAEDAIIYTIRKHYPDHAIIAEESGDHAGSDITWIIDPLDGTTNYLHAFPVYCVSIAVREKERVTHGVVYDPLRQEMFTASRGAGAQLEGRKIRVSGRRELSESLIGTGFPYRAGQSGGLDIYLAMLRAVLQKTSGVRRAGAAALDLAYVAGGRLDGFWELGLKPWDVAAGALLIQEAGGIVTGIDGSDDYLERGHILAGSPKILAALARLMAPHADKAIAALGDV
jgi:myo-inositol-1(or 4)-monophosphatase